MGGSGGAGLGAVGVVAVTCTIGVDNHMSSNSMNYLRLATLLLVHALH